MVRSDSPVRSHAASAPTLLKRHLRKAPELAAVQLLGAKFAQDFYSAHANAQMLIDAITVELLLDASCLRSGFFFVGRQEGDGVFATPLRANSW
jgi:hypothetical protein